MTMSLLIAFAFGFATAKVPAEWWAAAWKWLKERIAALKAMRGG